MHQPIGSPESVKAELAKINKRQDDIIRFIRHYEEEQLNPMIRTTHSIALRFDTITKAMESVVISHLEASKERQTSVLPKVNEQLGKYAEVINHQGKQLSALYQIHQRDYKKLVLLIQLYTELSLCGVMDSKRKEALKTEIMNLINSLTMHIDLAPPSKGTYNNAGSCRALASYMEHEDLERMEKGLFTDGFFNLTDDNIFKSAVVKDIDNNIGQLMRTDAKFFAIHVSPSESEIRAMGTTEQEQAEAMKRYIREVFIHEYAKNFKKGLSAEDIKFYGKIHFDRNRSDNELNLHCHLIISRKDQTNRKKLSPLTNHKNTKRGTVTGGFDRVQLFQKAEQGFDELFGYDRQQTESFEYANTMKNGSISEKLSMQELLFAGEKRKEPKQFSEMKKDRIVDNNQDSKFSSNLDNLQTDNLDNKITTNQDNNSTLGSLISFVSSGEESLPNNPEIPEEELLKLKKKKRKGRKL